MWRVFKMGISVPPGAGCPLAGGLAAARQGLVPGACARATPLMHARVGVVLALHADLPQVKVAPSSGSGD